MSYSGVQSSATVLLRGDSTDGITGRNIVFLRLIIIRHVSFSCGLAGSEITGFVLNHKEGKKGSD